MAACRGRHYWPLLSGAVTALNGSAPGRYQGLCASWQNPNGRLSSISISPDTGVWIAGAAKRFERYLAMVLADKATYFRRFTVKFVEIVAAGIGTAVSGYVVAYVTGHLSWFTPAAVKPGAPAPQAISTPVGPKQAVAASAEAKSAEPKTTIEATVRAALASHDISEAPAPQRPAPAAPIAASVATSTATPAVASPAAATPAAAMPAAAAPAAPMVAPPLATAEIKTVPVATAAEAPLPAAEPDGWPSDPAPVGALPARSGRMLPPQPPPANINVLGALRHFF